jgi:hypothetical protein
MNLLKKFLIFNTLYDYCMESFLNVFLQFPLSSPEGAASLFVVFFEGNISAKYPNSVRPLGLGDIAVFLLDEIKFITNHAYHTKPSSKYSIALNNSNTKPHEHENIFRTPLTNTFWRCKSRILLKMTSNRKDHCDVSLNSKIQ